MDRQEDEMIFEKRLIFPENDYRIEYRGEMKDNRVLHGVGSLTVVNEKTYKSSWVENQSQEHHLELAELESDMKQRKMKEAEAEKQKLEEYKKTANQMLMSFLLKENATNWLTEFKKLDIDEGIKYALEHPFG